MDMSGHKEYALDQIIGQFESIWVVFAHRGGAVAGLWRYMGCWTSEKQHQKVDAKMHADKVTNNMSNGSENHAKNDVKICLIYSFTKRVNTHETI